MNNCPRCHSRNPRNANLCLHCNAALPRLQESFEARTAATSRNTLLFILLTGLLIGGVLLYVREQSAASATDATVHTVTYICLPRTETDLTAPYLAHGYEECDPETLEKCPGQTICLQHTITGASMRSTP